VLGGVEGGADVQPFGGFTVRDLIRSDQKRSEDTISEACLNSSDRSLNTMPSAFRRPSPRTLGKTRLATERGEVKPNDKPHETQLLLCFPA
jgi:hypothetical protein